MAGALTAADRGLAAAADLLAAARRVVALTGAGISAESGLQTFRGGGAGTPLWEGHRPEEVATPEAFARDPALVWRFYDARRAAAEASAPNAGHVTLARLEASGRFDSFDVVTQNVDGLHTAAGSRRVHEIHGSIRRLRCDSCGAGTTERPAGAVPRCACGGLLRPDVVWFGEPLPASVLAAALSAARASDLCLVIGTSALVQPAASIPFEAAAAGARLVEVNPDVTPLSGRCDVVVRAPAARALPAIAEALA